MKKNNMLVVQNLNTGVVQRSTLLSDNEKALAIQLISKGFNWVPWFCTAEPELGEACRVSRNMTMDASSNYWGRILNVTKNYYTTQGRNFEQMMVNELVKMGVKVSSSADISTVANEAILTGGDYKTPLAAILSDMSLGQSQSEITSTLLSSSNKKYVLQAIDELGYMIPPTTDINGMNDIRLLYWGVYYLKNYNIPSLNSTNCGQIGQSLSQLNFEQAQIKKNELDGLFTIYTADEWNIRQQVVSDLYTKFNGLYARLNCTSAQATQGNDVIKYALYGVGILFGLLVIKKIFSKSKPAA